MQTLTCIIYCILQYTAYFIQLYAHSKNEELKTKEKHTRMDTHSSFHLNAIEKRALNQISIFLFQLPYCGFHLIHSILLLSLLFFYLAPPTDAFRCAYGYCCCCCSFFFNHPGLCRFHLIGFRFVKTAATQTSIILGNIKRIKRADEVAKDDAAAKTAADAAEQERQRICYRFEKPPENKTIFSPIDTRMLVDTYPPSIQCTLKLEGEHCNC